MKTDGKRKAVRSGGSPNTVTPPNEWAFSKKVKAVWCYGIETCANCGRHITQAWMFRLGEKRHVCEKCYDKGVRW